MKTLTVRLPEPLVSDIEAESCERKISKSDVVRQRLERAPRKRQRTTSLNAIADLIGSVDGLPTDLTARKKEYLQDTGYGQNVLVDAGFVWRCLAATTAPWTSLACQIPKRRITVRTAIASATPMANAMNMTLLRRSC